MLKLLPIIFLVFTTIINSSSVFGQGHIQAIQNGERDFIKIREAFYTHWEANGSPYRELKRFKRWEDIMVPRLQKGLIPSTEYFNRKNKLFNTEKSILSTSRVVNEQWKAVGLLEWEVASGGYNPGNGRVNCVTVDPNDKNTIYVGAASGGFWMSNDNGASWITSTDDLGALGITDIYVNPDNTSQIIILTGDAYGNDTPSTGLFKSEDKGDTWSKMNLEINRDQFRTFFKFEVGSVNKNLMLVAGAGIHRSADGGDTWTEVSTRRVTDLVFHPTNDDIIYASPGFEGNDNTITLLKSIDGGITWNESKFTFNEFDKRLARQALGVSLDAPDVLYILATDSDATFGGLFRSDDKGATLIHQSSSPNIFGYAPDASDSDGQGWYDLAIGVNPKNIDEIYVSGVHIWKSSNAGVDWELQNYWIWGDKSVSLPYVHADNHTIDFYHDNLYVGGDGGIFYSEDDGTSFTNLSFGLNIAQFYRIGLHPTNEDGIIGGLQDNGSNTRHNDIWYHIFGADGMDALIDHTDPSTVYSEFQFGGIVRYKDHGLEVDLQITNPDGESGGWITPFIQHPVENETLYFGYENVWKSSNRGTTLRKISSFENTNLITILKIHQSKPDNLIIGRANQLYSTINDGGSWENITEGLPSEQIQDAILDVQDPIKLWAGFSGGLVYKSVDGGTTWMNVSNGLPNLVVNTLAQHPCGNTLYAGTDIGVYSKDLSNNTDWTYMGEGLPNVIVRELEVQESSNKLYAGTYGRGVWKINIPEKVIGNVDQAIIFDEVVNLTFDQKEFILSASTDSGLDIIFESDNENVIEIEGNIATIKGLGNANITALQPGDCVFGAASISQNISVTKGNQTINFTAIPEELRMIKGEQFILEAKATSNLPVIFTSSDESLISINGKAAKVANLEAGGIVRITASQPGNENYSAAEEVVQEQTVLILNTKDIDNYNSTFPNPAKSYIELPNQAQINETYQIFNLDGRLVASGKTSKRITLSGLQRGIYLLIVEDTKYKIIKQ